MSATNITFKHIAILHNRKASKISIVFDGEKIRILGEQYAVSKNHEHDTHSASNELLYKCSFTILCLKVLFVK